jgi:hypothetical protein
MKSKEEIEQLAEQYIEDNTGDHYVYCGFVDGYNQCQEDMAEKKYTEEDVINIVNKSRETGLTAEYLILQLNKQD